MPSFTPIPRPPAVPLLGNIANVDRELPVNSFLLLAKQYGPIFQLVTFGQQVIFVNTQHLSHQVADETKFRKVIDVTLGEVRNLVGDGLFTASHDEPNWGIAHRILMPAFGPASIRGMYEDMMDIADQLCMKWDRFGPRHVVDPADDFTRLAFDTIALCAMNYRLNSFYQKDLPSFIGAMGDFLVESGLRAKRPRVVQAVMRQTNNKYQADIKLMNDLAEEIVAERRANPIQKKDLLNMMINGRDPKTGQSLDDTNIRNQLVTFLIAGHETTSGMLSFALYHLLKHPAAYAKVQAEVDEVLGDRAVTLSDLPKLPYLQAVLRETLRITSPITARGAGPIEDTVLRDGDKVYEVKKGAVILVSYFSVHRDTAIWGEDVEEFRPERMMDGKFEALPPNSWEPFGNGARSCIGRPFAWQEGQIALASVMQRFNFRLCDPSYTLELKQTLTVKPKNFKVYAIPREGKRIRHFAPSASEEGHVNEPPMSSSGLDVSGPLGSQPLYVFYGSNTGSSENFAQKIVAEASSKGFMSKLGTLDSVAGRLPTDGPVVIVTASFEGEPADNAGHFVQHLKSMPDGNQLANVQYAIFGCGNHDWVNTYQKIPRLCDDAIAAHGGIRILSRGEGDAGGSEFFEDFEEWEGKLWAALQEKYGKTLVKGTEDSFKVAMSKGTERSEHLRQETALGVVIENRVLTAKGAPEKRHIEIQLPEDMTYRSGDYIAILPANPMATIKRILKRYSLSEEQEITISATSSTMLPTDKPISLVELLRGYVELTQTATRKNVQSVIDVASGATKTKIQGLLASFTTEVHEKRLSVLDILEAYPDIDLPFASYLQILPSMRIRQYSISSSPLWNSQHVTLTVGVLDAPALSGRPEKFLGVASNYLANLSPGDKVQVSVRASSAAFHLPEDPSVPAIMFAAGSGMAPMRGFIQERASQAESGRTVAKSILFFGCRKPEEDYLYSDAELKEWVEAGVVEVLPAFSRQSDASEGCKYVQDRIWKERAKVVDLFDKGAKIYTCGTSNVANGIKQACIRIIEDTGHEKEEAERFWNKIQKERFATDVFG